MNATKEFFLNQLEEQIRLQGEVLVLIYYNGGIGSRDFVLLKTKREFIALLNELRSSDEITVFRSKDILFEDLSSGQLLSKIKEGIPKCSSGDWLVMWKRKEGEKIGYWNFFDSLEELEIDIIEEGGENITVFCEPDWHDEATFIRGYVPDKYGNVKVGRY